MSSNTTTDILLDQDRRFLEFVRANRNIGYGRMMQIIALEWGHGHIPCSFIGTHQKEERERFYAFREYDPLFSTEGKGKK